MAKMGIDTSEFNKFNVAKWMQRNVIDYTDKKTNEVDITRMAEECAAYYDQNHEGGPLDDETHWIWELAAEFN